jgi:Tol biopolymer transport system component
VPVLAIALAVLVVGGVTAGAVRWNGDRPADEVTVRGVQPLDDPQPTEAPPSTAAVAPAEPVPEVVTTTPAPPPPAAVAPPPVRRPPPVATTAPTSASLTGKGLYIIGPDGAGLRRLATGSAHSPAWSPDGTHLVFLKDNSLFLVGADGSGERHIASSRFGGRWSPDGSQIAAIIDGAVFTIDVRRGDRREVAGGGFSAVDWSPNGSRFALLSINTIEVIGVDGSGRRTLVKTASSDGGAVWSPDSRRLAYLDFERGPSVVDADTGAVTPLVGQQNMGWRMSWSPDGHSLAFADYRNFSSNNLSIARADGSGVRTVVEGAVAPAFSPEGSRIAYGSYRNPGATAASRPSCT